ncbi:precorrin-8X methylmutase [Desulfurispirillum indicum]|uniref:precorrin-8X methylmutase n=1 Tax=Desulfurispirillum indicum TaxID=936456 RepID=UPI001CFA07E9|nr:precorrin-8X methylmutase [Desulfurispirillum indicum]UCZ55757.1 precorrin-8X methylmutase [Desulfurispirillum indicum]
MDKGLQIEHDSFAIIDANTDLSRFTSEEQVIARKLIHTTGDLEFAQLTSILPGAVEAGVAALRRGAPIICDVEMVRVGITTRYLQHYGNPVLCFISEPEVLERARAENLTRAETAMLYAAERYPDALYAIGNAPTALLKLLELTAAGAMQPAFVAGLPVGFVKAEESKDLLRQTTIPHVTNLGPKGGSPCAATVINGLLVVLAQGQ